MFDEASTQLPAQVLDGSFESGTRRLIHLARVVASSQRCSPAFTPGGDILLKPH
jgi:hypothetical protein